MKYEDIDRGIICNWPALEILAENKYISSFNKSKYSNKIFTKYLHLKKCYKQYFKNGKYPVVYKSNNLLAKFWILRPPPKAKIGDVNFFDFEIN